jgi:hypothetical protein
MRPIFGREYIEDEFQRITGGLTDPLTVYLIGGGAMSLRDLEGATKDIDLVVPDGDAYGQLWAVLMDLGYAEVQSLDSDYRALGATSCVENDEWVSPRHLHPAGREQACAHRRHTRAQRAVPRHGSIDSPVGANHLAVDKKVIRINSAEYWLHGAVDPTTIEILHLRLFPVTRKQTTRWFLSLYTTVRWSKTHFSVGLESVGQTSPSRWESSSAS